MTRVLYLAHRVPFPPDKGDRIRVYNILRGLARRAEVWLGCLADEPTSEKQRGELESHCRQVVIAPLGKWERWPRALWSLLKGRTVSEGAFCSPSLRQAISQWEKDLLFDAVLISSSALAAYVDTGRLAQTRRVADLMDVDSQKWLDYQAHSRPPKSWIYGLEARRLRQLEIRLGRDYSGLTVVSEAEAALYRRFGPEKAIHAIPNGVDLDYFRPLPGPEDLSCIFVGAFDYKPNVDGACWFASEVWPRLLAKQPTAVLRIVGRNPHPAVRKLSELPGVEVTGAVPDVRDAVAKSAVVIVPLRIARGIQNKLLEGMAMAKAVVSSAQALNGVHAEPGKHLIRANAASEWVTEIERLWQSPPERERLGRAARSFVEEHHSWESCLSELWPLLGIPRQK